MPERNELMEVYKKTREVERERERGRSKRGRNMIFLLSKAIVSRPATYRNTGEDPLSYAERPDYLPDCIAMVSLPPVQSPTHRILSAHHCVLVGQGPLPQRTIYFNQPLSAYVDLDKIGRKPAIADDIYHYPE